MSIDLDVLEGLAKAARPAKWRATNEAWVVGSETGPICIMDKPFLGRTAGDNSANAAFIAAANPETVLALIAAARERDGLREALTEIAEIAAFEDADDNISRDDFSRGVRAARLDVGRIARQALKQETQS